MARLVQDPPRFTHKDWTTSNLTKYANADTERQAAERLVAESLRLSDETEERREKTQDDVKKKFEQRMDDIKYWEKELKDKLHDLKMETDSLNAFKIRVEKALEASSEPLHIAKQCLNYRERRRGIDLVHDDVQKELFKEVETIQGVQALLTRSIEQSKEQQRLNRKATWHIEQDLKDKNFALDVDSHCNNLRNNSSIIGFKDNPAKIETNSTSPDEWKNFSNTNIIRGEQERQASTALRSLLDGILQQTTNDMVKQCEAVNRAFERRIAETKNTKRKLGDNLNRVTDTIREMEENIDKLYKAIEDKMNPLKLTHTRLDTRTQRPNVELCRDHVQYRLIEEFHELEQSIASLKDRLANSTVSLKGLIQNQLELENDIDIKNNTLFIDEVECMGSRKSINLQQF